MLHPGSVWSVDYHKPENQCAELVTGCSDGMARIWTRDPAHAISEVEMQSYYENVQAAGNYFYIYYYFFFQYYFNKKHYNLLYIIL